MTTPFLTPDAQRGSDRSATRKVRFLLRLLICILYTFGLGSILVFYALPWIIAVRDLEPERYFAGSIVSIAWLVTLVDVWEKILRDSRCSGELRVGALPPSIEEVSEDGPEI